MPSEPKENDTSIIIPFDSGDAGRFEYEVYPEHVETGDAIVLALDRKACRSFAEIFKQLADGDHDEGYHFHLGWDESDCFGPGFRIVLTKEGRIPR